MINIGIKGGPHRTKIHIDFRLLKSLCTQLMTIRGLTWHDDVREAKFAGDGDAAVENHRILSTDLFRLSPEQLEGDDQSCSGIEKERYGGKRLTTLTLVLRKV